MCTANWMEKVLRTETSGESISSACTAAHHRKWHSWREFSCTLSIESFPSLMSVFVALRDVIGFAISHSRWRLFYFGEIPRAPQTANSSIMSIHLRGSRDFNARVGLNQNNSAAPSPKSLRAHKCQNKTREAQNGPRTRKAVM